MINVYELPPNIPDLILFQTKIELVIITNIENVRVTFIPDALSYTQLENMKGEYFPKHKHQQIFINIPNSKIHSYIPKPKENEIIEYSKEYDKVLFTEFERKFGSDGMIFTNYSVIEKQKAVVGYLLKNIGYNLIKGKSIMNVSLPINVFDTRTILELYAWQNAYASILLEKGALATDKLEKLKWSTAFVITRFHLTGAQLKPFNPILGETFQCKINDSMFYFEQTSHHPPIFNFYVYLFNLVLWKIL